MLKIGTSGFRGIEGKTFDENVVCQIAQATANVILKNNLFRHVVVGYDKRENSKKYAHLLCRVLCANKIAVTLTDSSVPTPLVAFACKQTGDDIALMVTASHNPFEYNGIKIFSYGGADLDTTLEKLFDEEVANNPESKIITYKALLKSSHFCTKDFVDDYLASIEKMLVHKNFEQFTLFETMNGSSFVVAKRAIKRFDMNCQIMQFGDYCKAPLLAPIPSEENLRTLSKLAVDANLNFAFATDGDGDRTMVVTNDGQFHNANEIACLLYHFAITKKGKSGAFVGNYSFSNLGKQTCKKLGTQFVESKIGFKNIGKKMRETDALVGAENSGIAFKDHVFSKDGMAAFLLLNEVIDFYNAPLSKILKNFEKEIGYNMVYLESSFKIFVFDENSFAKKLKSFEPKMEEKQIGSKGNLDGVKFVFEDGSWALVRRSGTENLLRIVVEAFSKEECNNLTQKLKNQIAEHFCDCMQFAQTIQNAGTTFVVLD